LVTTNCSNVGAEEAAVAPEPDRGQVAAAAKVVDGRGPQPEQLAHLLAVEDVLAPERTITPRVARRRVAHPSTSSRSASRMTLASNRQSAVGRCGPSSPRRASRHR
jgi:hypothetical protein